MREIQFINDGPDKKLNFSQKEETQKIAELQEKKLNEIILQE